MYFKNELKYSKRSDHETEMSCPSFGKEKNCHVKNYFSANFLCRVMKRQLSTALGLVSGLFAHAHCPF